MFQKPRNAAAKALLNAFVAVLFASAPLSGAIAEDDVWPMLRKDAFGDREIEDGKDLLILDAPDQAEDAAIVPITVRIPPEFDRPLKALTLIIDKNPSPVAATFTFGPAAGLGGGERRMSTRVRVDMYSHIRAILETEDGKLHMVTRFIKAAGGCSAPLPKETAGTDPDLGKIIIKSFDPAVDASPLREAQVMIRHPNTNGMQRDPVTQGYFRARFVKEMVVTRGSDLVFRMESGISISSDPNFRFTYAMGADNTLDVKVTDTDETVFTAKAGARGS